MADQFENECDRLSNAIDSIQFERIRWGRTEGPMLERFVGLARASIADRAEFEMTEEGSVPACRRLVLKVHDFRVMAINIALEGTTVTVWGAEIERGKGRVADAQRRSADYSAIDEAWMRDAIRGIFSEIQ